MNPEHAYIVRQTSNRLQRIPIPQPPLHQISFPHHRISVLGKRLQSRPSVAATRLPNLPRVRFFHSRIINPSRSTSHDQINGQSEIELEHGTANIERSYADMVPRSGIADSLLSVEIDETAICDALHHGINVRRPNGNHPFLPRFFSLHMHSFHALQLPDYNLETVSEELPAIQQYITHLHEGRQSNACSQEIVGTAGHFRIDISKRAKLVSDGLHIFDSC
mmetsp:Transcript_26548/g.55454  ORF Transcript_26548/g.55454 Transcript_26548/m.55454 type:complete len:221 (-) Transcript_26548:283-945(-)